MDPRNVSAGPLQAGREGLRHARQWPKTTWFTRAMIPGMAGSWRRERVGSPSSASRRSISALIYPPGNFADTDELAAVTEAMAPYGGLYITHMRSEADRYLEAIDEAIGARIDGHRVGPAVGMVEQEGGSEHGPR